MRRTLVVGAAVALCTSSAIGARVAPASRSLPASDQPPLARTVHPPIAPSSSRAIWPRLRPLRRIEKNRIIMSCTQPPSTAPTRIHSVPGR